MTGRPLTKEDETRIERMWQGFALMVIKPNSGLAQRQDMRRAFWAGCGALFTEIQNMMDGGVEETDSDLQRMALLDVELREYYARLKNGLE